MRALTIHQPWAGLIVAGVKDVENRTWSPPSTIPQWFQCLWCDERAHQADNGGVALHNHNGGVVDAVPDGPFPFRLGIHAAKRPFGLDSPEADALRDRTTLEEYRCLKTHVGGDPELVRNYTLGALVGFATVTGCHHADECEYEHGDTAAYSYCSRWAEPGDVYHWQFADPEPLDEPIPMRGYQGLWTLDEDAVAASKHSEVSTAQVS